MAHEESELEKIRGLLSQNPRGLTIEEVSQLLPMSRPSAAKYLNVMVAQGQAAMRQYGRAKVYSLCERVPFTHMISLSSDLIIVMDKNLFVTQVNDQVLSFFRCEKTDIVGKSLEFTPIGGYLSIDAGMIRGVIDGREMSSDLEVSFEGVLHYFRTRVVPLLFESEEQGVAIVMQDITLLKRSHHELEGLVHERTKELVATNKSLQREIQDHKRAEKDLALSEGKHRTLIETIHEGIWVMDSEGVTTFVNPRMASMLGYLPEEIIGRHLFTYLDEQGITAIRGAFNDVRHISSKHDVRLVRKDGTRVHVLFSFSRMQGNENGYSGIIAGVMDISDRIMLEQALLQTGKKLSLLTSVTRHDVLNLLNVLQGTVGMLEYSTKEPDNTRLLEKIRNTASRIEKEMFFSREFKDVGVNPPLWVNLDTTLDQSVINMDLEGLKIENGLHGLEVYADPLIGKVFSNLVDNTIRHGEGASTISFSYRTMGEDIAVVCEDDGVGVPQGIKSKIFEQNFGRNYGLGLFLVREILSIYGMSISESGIPGRGARFEIRVPEGAFRHVTPVMRMDNIILNENTNTFFT